MEFDGLRSVVQNVSTDYSQRNVSNNTNSSVEKNETTNNASAEQVDTGKSVSAKKNNADNKNTAESIKNELTELQESISNEFFEKFVSEANKKIFATNREFSFSYHEGTNRIAVKILDKSTKEVIREIPPEKSLDAAAKMLELVGVLFDEKV